MHPAIISLRGIQQSSAEVFALFQKVRDLVITLPSFLFLLHIFLLYYVLSCGLKCILAKEDDTVWAL